MDYEIKYIGGDEAVVTFTGNIHIDCRENKDQEFKDKMNNLIDEFSI